MFNGNIAVKTTLIAEWVLMEYHWINTHSMETLGRHAREKGDARRGKQFFSASPVFYLLPTLSWQMGIQWWYRSLSQWKGFLFLMKNAPCSSYTDVLLPSPDSHLWDFTWEFSPSPVNTFLMSAGQLPHLLMASSDYVLFYRNLYVAVDGFVQNVWIERMKPIYSNLHEIPWGS